MLSLVIWWSGLLLGLLILFRGFHSGALRKYPFFYAYLISVSCKSVLLHFAFGANPDSYRFWYWRTDILTLVVGCGIILDIADHVLVPYPGAERFARISGLTIFGLIFSFIIASPWIIPGQSLAGTMIELERDLRAVQAIFLFGILAVVFHYGIATGRNMKGMISGYVLYVGSSLITLATQAYAGTAFYQIWRIAQPLSWNISLLVWAWALWSFKANPAVRTAIQLDDDYEVFAAKTRSTVGAMRSYLARPPRP